MKKNKKDWTPAIKNNSKKEETTIIEQCQPCQYHEKSICSIYISPAKKWRSGSCLMIRGKKTENQEKKESANKSKPKRNKYKGV